MTQSEREQHMAVVRERDMWRERCERAEAENARLRKALGKVRRTALEKPVPLPDPEACPHCHGPLGDDPFEADEETARGRHEPGAVPGRAEAPGRVQGRAPPVLAVARRPRGPRREQPLGTRGQPAGGGPQVEPRLAVRQGRGDARRVHVDPPHAQGLRSGPGRAPGGM